jgi:hypothetical protein
MKKSEKQAITSTIYNTNPKTKAQMRAESEKALAKFLKTGGVIEYGRKTRTPKSKMSCKSSKSFNSGTSGFATGYPRKSTGAV